MISHINDLTRVVPLDQWDRDLNALRAAKLMVLIQKQKARRPRGLFLLEVGSAHGWFFYQAAQYFLAVEIEPVNGMHALSKGQGLNVRYGYFPEVLELNECFDVTVFNGVLEPIPHTDQALEACARHLNPDCLLLLNLPNSSGVS